jgi:ornithine--oxo-acid transaminase
MGGRVAFAVGRSCYKGGMTSGPGSKSIESAATRTAEIIAQTNAVGAHNYAPLPVVITHAEGVWAQDVEGRRFLDCISAYSSLNHGHRHPAIIAALVEQAGRLTLTSRAVHNDRLGPFLAKLCDMAGMDRALPMNTGVEAVETAIKLARKWGYRVKGIPRDAAEIIVCRNNFHGRTTTVVGFSSEPQYFEHFGPYGPGFVSVDFGNAGQLEAAINANTAAFLFEPIQAEGGVLMPPEGFLTEARRICAAHDVLMMADEIQTGLGRTGRLFACDHEPDAKPDVLILGKALGGGVYPVSAVLASTSVMGVLAPGDHGSTFGGNPLAAAVGQCALEVLEEEGLVAQAAERGAHLLGALRQLQSPAVREVRGRGLLIGVEIDPAYGTAHDYCLKLLEVGILAKDTHVQVIRLAPPLTIATPELDWLVARLDKVFAKSARSGPP